MDRNQLNPTTIPSRTKGIELEVLGSEIVLTCPGDRVVHLDPPAALIWSLADGARDIGGLIDELARYFPQAGGRIREDVETTIRGLAEEGCLEIQEATPPPVVNSENKSDSPRG
jgi:hypothetical protein